MTHILVKFVEDGLYHVCPRSTVRYDTEEFGLVSAKYKGMFFRAVVIAEGDKQNMEDMKQRCILNDTLISKYKFPSPAATSTITSPEPSTSKRESVKKMLFGEKATTPLPQLSATPTTISSPGPSFIELKTTSYEEKQETLPINEQTLYNVLEEMERGEYENEDFENEAAADNPEEVVEGLEDDVPDKVTAEDENTTQQPQRKEKFQEGTASKKYYCPFCRQLYSKFARHLFQVHGGEDDIKKISALESKHPERIKVIANLRAEGSRIYNSLQSSPNKIIVPRQKVGMKREQYIACFMCGNMYKHKFLHRHVKICPSAEGVPVTNPLRVAKMQSYRTPGEDNESTIQFSRDVLSGIREGEVKQVITKDPLLKEYGIYLSSLYGSDKHLVNLIRIKLRQVSEVLLEMRKLDKDIVYLSDIFYTTKKTTLFEAIKKVTGFEGGRFKRPAMANEMGTLLQHCARRLISQLLEKNDKERIKDVKRWIELIKADYNALISKHARKHLDENKWNKPKTLPLTEDLIKLNNFVKETADRATNELKKGFDYVQWVNLNKATMVKILIFNRKRVGDVQRIRVEDFNKAHNVQRDTITYQLLSESERITCTKYMRVQVRGKHAKVVPILLTKDTMESIKLIISLRDQAGIPESNPFAFARNKEEPFPASSSLRYFAYNCGARRPKLLTGTKLRQEIATATQAFNFSENDLALLANYLGHTVQTHREFYRLPDEAIHLAKISKVLEIVDSGKAAELKGKSLSELEDYVTTMIEKANVEDQGQIEGEIAVLKKINPGTPKRTRTVVRRTWTTPEKHVMKTYFKHHLANGTLPTPDECKDAKFKYSPLRTRTVEQIKAWINNYNKRLIKAIK